MKKKDFLSLANYTFNENRLNDGTSDEVYSCTFNLYRYEYNYEWMIRDYFGACGAKIIETNHNWFNDRFYIYYTLPTKYIEPEEFFDNYSKYKQFQPMKYKWFILFSVLILVLVAFIWIINHAPH